MTISKNKTIPKYIYQTYTDKRLIPKKVYKNIKKYASEYKHIIFNNEECLDFLKKNYSSDILKTYQSIKRGAHRTDLFRYCLLYKYGGIYLDIKTKLINPINKIFNNNYLYTCISSSGNSIYQGVIATPPNNPIFKILINYIVNNYNRIDILGYHIFTKHFYQMINESCNNKPRNGLNINQSGGNNIFLFIEKCSGNPSDCYDGLDRYGLCCYIYDNNDNMIIKTRYSDYPW